MRNELKILFSEITLYSSYLSLFFLYFKNFYKKIKLKPVYLFILLPIIWSLIANFLYIGGWERDSLWDINVVYCADVAYSTGADPYRDWFNSPECQESTPLQFTYLKLVLDALPFASFEYDFFEKIWVSFLVIITIFYGFFTAKLFKLETNIIFNIIFIVVMFQGANVVALQAGNISAVIYFLVLIAILLLQSYKYRSLFFLIIAIASFVKFHLALLLLIPFVLDKKFDFKGYIIFFLVLLSLFFLNYIVHGDFINQWVENLAYVDWGLGPRFSDISFLQPLWLGKIRDVEFNAIVKVLLIPLFLINIFYFKTLIKNKFTEEESNDFLLVLTSLIFILVLPRLKVYDFLFLSCIALKIYTDCIKDMFSSDRLIKAICLGILLLFYSLLIYWRPQWDGSNNSYYFCFGLYILYQFLIYFRCRRSA
tara:strand:+ start:614 stop:1885 length:1272 start_codon:yes stop_codon:yes gene_type:complete